MGVRLSAFSGARASSEALVSFQRILQSSNEKDKANYYVLDLSGKLLLSSSIELQKGSNSFVVNTAQLTSGTYVIKLVTESFSDQFKFIKQ